jgi:hypothetical protein
MDGATGGINQRKFAADQLNDSYQNQVAHVTARGKGTLVELLLELVRSVRIAASGRNFEPCFCHQFFCPASVGSSAGTTAAAPGVSPATAGF